MRTCSPTGQHNRAHLVRMMRTPIDIRGLDFIPDQLLRRADLFECMVQPVCGIGITLGIKKQEAHRRSNDYRLWPTASRSPLLLVAAALTVGGLK